MSTNLKNFDVFADNIDVKAEFSLQIRMIIIKKNCLRFEKSFDVGVKNGVYLLNKSLNVKNNIYFVFAIFWTSILISHNVTHIIRNSHWRYDSESSCINR